eukprot:GHRR01004410.1.p3 GENE.GHRR01004410.1~~GHRR01004410.1.p3  ORF type:complete len:104 (+),score=29.76 GHRR01004410.1:409-720(+)
MADSQEPVLVEGDEEVQYVYITLPKDTDTSKFGPGNVVVLEGLGTDAPVLRTQQSDYVMVGTYSDSLGSVLLIRQQPGAAANSEPVCSYIGHTNKQLQFIKPE